MGASLVVRRIVNPINDALTRYFGIVGGSSPSLEVDAQLQVRQAGTASKLFSYVSTNTASVTSVLTMRKSGADTALTVSYTSDQTGVKEDTSNSVSYANTDEIDYQLVVPSEAGTNTITFTALSFAFTPTATGDTVSWVGGTMNNSSFTTDSVTRFNCSGGGRDGVSAWTATEANAQWRVRGTFTVRDLFVNVQSNARTTDTVFRSRKNTADGNLTVTYTSGQTGIKEDTSNTDSVVAGDDHGFSMTTSTGGSAIVVSGLTAHVVSTAREFVVLAQDGATGAVIAFNTTTYGGVGGYIEAANGLGTTEAHSQVLPQFNFTFKELATYVSANTILTSATTCTLRDNGADSALQTSYATLETGWKVDSSNQVAITGGSDEVAIKYATPNTAGSITFRTVCLIGVTAAGNPWYAYAQQ